MKEVRQRDMILWSTNLMAARFAAIQGCPGTWLKNPKYCYLPILMYKEHQSSYLCIGEISLSISNGCWKYRPSFIRDCLMKWNRWQTPQLLIPPGLSSLYQIWYKPGKKGDTGGLYCGLSRPDFASVEIVLVLTRYCSFLDFLSESNSV